MRTEYPWVTQRNPAPVSPVSVGPTPMPPGGAGISFPPPGTTPARPKIKKIPA